jgi:cyclic pyranopterin phosphate synthase
VSELTHINADGDARMVDVSAKPVQTREAVASGEIRLAKATLDAIESGQAAKGNVLATARLAGIMAAKKTAEVNFETPPSRDRIVITATARIAAQTGIEMEALTAVSVAALTIYDMCKALDKQMQITDIRLLSKTKR